MYLEILSNASCLSVKFSSSKEKSKLNVFFEITIQKLNKNEKKKEN